MFMPTRGAFNCQFGVIQFSFRMAVVVVAFSGQCVQGIPYKNKKKVGD